MSYDHYFWQLREIQRTLDRLQPQLDNMMKVIPSAVQAQLDQLRWIQESYTLPTEYLDAVTTIQKALQSSPVLDDLSLLTSSEGRFLREIGKRQEELQLLTERIAGAQDLIRLPAEWVVESLVPIEALLKSRDMSEQVLQAMTLPQLAYQSFAESQLELAATATSKSVRTNRLLFVDAAGQLLEDMTKGFELALLMEKSLSTSEVKPEWEVNVYAELAARAEDVDFEDEEFDAEAFVYESCEGKVTELGSRLIRLVYDLNTEAEREGRSPVFKPTTKNLYACGTIPICVATEDGTFNYVVDQLYFLLYEGSGSSNRLKKARSAKHFEALDRLRDLRLGGRHDVDHGKQKDIEKKNRNVGEAFYNLIGIVVPRDPLDWCRAQVALYQQLVDMLEKLWFGDDEPENSEPLL